MGAEKGGGAQANTVAPRAHSSPPCTSRPRQTHSCDLSGHGQAWGWVMGRLLIRSPFDGVLARPRRSSLVPTRRMGVCGQWCRTSGYHCGDGGALIPTLGPCPPPGPEQATALKGPSSCLEPHLAFLLHRATSRSGKAMTKNKNMPRSFQAHQGLSSGALLSLGSCTHQPYPKWNRHLFCLQRTICLCQAFKQETLPCKDKFSGQSPPLPRKPNPASCPAPWLEHSQRRLGSPGRSRSGRRHLGEREGRRGPCGKGQKALNGLSPQHTHTPPGPPGLYPSHPAPAGTLCGPYSLWVGEGPAGPVCSVTHTARRCPTAPG